MEDLPDEILLRIFKDVDDHSLFKNCSVVCKRWHRILDWNYWASILVSDTNEHAEQYRRLFEQFPQMKQNSAPLLIDRPLGRNLTGDICGEVSVAEYLKLKQAHPHHHGNINIGDIGVSGLDTDWESGRQWVIEEPGSEHLLNSQHSVLASSYELSRINAFFTLRSLKPLLNYTQSSSEVKLKYTFSVEVSTRAFSGGEVITEVMKGLDQHRIYPNSDGAKHCTVTYLMPGTNWRWLTQTSDCSEFLEQPSPYAFIHPRVNCKDDRVWDGHFGPKVRRMRFCINLLKNEQQTQAGAAAQG